MKCEKLKVDGGVVFVCSRPRRHECQDCRAREARFQCDGQAPQRKSGTCDRWVCGQCKRGNGKLDFCKRCQTSQPQGELFR